MGRGEFLEYNTVVDYYRHFLGSSKSEVSDIGKFGRGMCFYHTGYIEEALTSFVNIYNQKMPYLNYIYGHYFGYNNYEKSVEYLKKEIESNPSNVLTSKHLALKYMNHEKPMVLNEMLKDSLSFVHVSNKAKRYTYFELRDLKNYTKAIFGRF